MNQTPQKVVSATREIDAPADVIFDLIADPARQPQWDGNDNLGRADEGQRVRAIGDVFVMHNANGKVKHNEVVDFEEGRRIAWKPADEGQPQPGHVWGWVLEPLDEHRTRVTHVYDWTNLTDEKRIPKASSMQAANLMASLDRLAAFAQRG